MSLLQNSLLQAALASASSSHSNSSSLHSSHGRGSAASLSSQGHTSQGSHGVHQPVEFNHAINYVNKIKVCVCVSCTYACVCLYECMPCITMCAWECMHIHVCDKWNIIPLLTCTCTSTQDLLHSTYFNFDSWKLSALKVDTLHVHAHACNYNVM